MKGKGKVIFLIIVGLLICCCGIYIFLLRYFFYNKYNIYAQRATLDRLHEMYNQEFGLLSIQFETKKTMTGGAKYIHIWTFTLEDNQGKQFHAYVNEYGVIKKGDGNFNALDYFNYIGDTYGQICIEERLDDEFALHQYRQKKESELFEQKDYIFVCTRNNAAKIAEVLTNMYFKETEFSSGGCLKCLVCNEEEENLFSYYWWSITRKLQEQNKEITEQTVYTYILQELRNKTLY